MKEYYIVKGEEKQGPFSMDELKGKSIFPNTLVWEESFDDWTRADEIPEIANVIVSILDSNAVKKEAESIPNKDSIRDTNKSNDVSPQRIKNTQGSIPNKNRKIFKSDSVYYLLISPIIYVLASQIISRAFVMLKFHSLTPNLQTAIWVLIGLVLFWVLIRIQPTKKLYYPIISVAVIFLLSRAVSYFIVSVANESTPYNFFEFIFIPMGYTIFYFLILIDLVAAFFINFYYSKSEKVDVID